MTQSKLQSNAAKLKRVKNDRDYTNLDVGRLGRLASDNTVDPVVDVAGRPGYIWVRRGINGERGQVQVMNGGVNTAFVDAPVKIGTRPTDGETCAYSVEYNSETLSVYGGNLIAASVPTLPSNADSQIKNSALINFGRVAPSTLIPDTLYVRIAPFFHNGTFLGNIDYDVGTANVPSNANEIRWCYVCVDMSNNAYTVNGTASVAVSTSALSLSNADDIVIPVGYIPVGLLTLSYAQTAIKNSRFEDGRYWLAQRGYLLSDGATTLTIASGVITAASASNIIVAAQSGTADDLDTITMTGTPRLITLQADAGDTITVKHSTGNIELNGGADYALSGDKTLALFWDGTNLADIGIGGSGGASPLTTKGDLYTYSATDARLPVGSAGQYLTVDSAETTGLKWTTLTAVAGAVSVLDVNTTGAGNVGTGEDDLIAYSMPANTLGANEDYVHIHASGTFATSANNKRLRFKMGATTLFDSGSLVITTAADWVMDGWIIRVGASSQKTYFTLKTSSATLSAYADYAAPTEDLTTTLTLKITGEATANDDVRAESMIAEKYTGSSAGQYPKRATMWHYDSLVLTGNAILQAKFAAAWYSEYGYQNPAAINDEFTNGFYLASGNYTLAVYGSIDINRGIIEWFVDGASQGTQDWYAGSGDAHTRKTLSISVLTSGWHVLRGLVATKNASSSGYFVVLTQMTITPSAD